jgi:hypothetical protein
MFLFASVLGACSTPKAGGLVAYPDALGGGRYVDKSRVDTASVRVADLSSIILTEIDTSRVSDQKGLSREEGAACLRWELTRSSSEPPEVLKLSGSGDAAQLEVAIVEMSTGNAGARILAGELGAGHAWVQVDARALDPNSGYVLAELSDRRRGSGAIGFRDAFGSSGPAMVCEMLEGIGRALQKELQVLFKGG